MGSVLEPPVNNVFLYIHCQFAVAVSQAFGDKFAPHVIKMGGAVDLGFKGFFFIGKGQQVLVV